MGVEHRGAGSNDSGCLSEMEMELTNRELVSIAVLLALSVAGAVVVQRVCWRLERLHPDEWQNLGKPNLFRSSGGNVLKLARFVFSGRFAALKDRHLTTLMIISIEITLGILAQMVFIAFWL